MLSAVTNELILLLLRMAIIKCDVDHELELGKFVNFRNFMPFFGLLGFKTLPVLVM